MADTISATFRKPFKEQVAAFRLRLGNLVPTSRWDDISRGMHDRAFMVAGATKADLLADLAAAVDKAITQGTSLEVFRRDFRQIVERHGWHGWTGEGTPKGEAWRTKIIYRTNLATTRAAGRRAQHFSGAFKYLVYRHSGAENYRPEHLAWNGLILPVDHPFWNTHYPINGWGCACFVRGARTLAGAIRVGGNPNVKLPRDWDKPDPRTGAPAGIDKGWDYAPGATVDQTIRSVAEKPIDWNYHLSRAFMKDLPEANRDAFAVAVRDNIAGSQSLRRWVERVSGVRNGAPITGPVIVEPQKTLGGVTTAQANRIEALGTIAPRGFDLVIDQDAVKHILKRHGNIAIERTRGQRAVSPNDFPKLGALLNGDAEITFLGNDPQQGPLIRYDWQRGNETYVAIFAIKRGRQRLKLVTFYIKAS